MNISENTAVFIYGAGAILAIGLFHGWTSRINQFFFFSRTARAGFDQTAGAKAVSLTYRMRIWLAAGAALMALAVLQALGALRGPANVLVALLVQQAASCTAFALAHRAAGELLAAEPQGMAPEASTGAAAVPLLRATEASGRYGLQLGAALAAVGLSWGGAMLASGLSPAGFLDALESTKTDFLSGLGAGLLAGSVVLYILLRYFSRHRTAFGNFTFAGAAQTAWLGAAALVGTALTVPFHLQVTHLAHQIILGVVLGFVALRMAYVWSRSRLFTPAQVERNGDEHWRLGMFYCNPDDPTLFIQHRSGPGYTVNFANFLSWPLTLLFVGNLVFLAVITSIR